MDVDRHKLDSTSRWVEEDALAVVGRSLSDEQRSVSEVESLPSTLLEPLCSLTDGGAGDEHGRDDDRRHLLPLFDRNGASSKSWKHFMMHVGPGFLMCIAYVDPGNLEADLQTGAGTGYRLLWVLLYSTILGGLLQALAAKLGVSTSRHLAQHCRDIYPGPMRIVLWLMAELAIIGSDIQEVVGTSLAVLLLTGGAVKLWQGVLLGAFGAYVLLFLEKFGLRWLESFFQLLVGILALCMTALFFVANVPYGQVLDGLTVPRLDAASLPTATGLLGAVIMPHNLFLHSALVHERGLPPSCRSTAKHSLFYYRIEAFVALLVTLVINVSVISVFAHGFYGGEGTSMSADSIGLYGAGTFLSEKYGATMGMVWALGLLSAGVSSTMTGTYAGQFVMSGFLDMKMGTFRRALVTRAVALVPTLAVALAFGQSYDEGGASSSLDSLNQWLNIMQSVQLPFAIIPLLFLTANPAVVGLGFVNSMATNVVSGTTAAVVISINIWTAAQTMVTRLGGVAVGWKVLLVFIVGAYVGSLVYLVVLSVRSLDGVSGVYTHEEVQERVGLLMGDDDGDDSQGEDEDAPKTAGRFGYVPPLPTIGHTMVHNDSADPAPSIASSRAASSMILSSRAGTRSHAVVVSKLDDE